MYTEMHTLTFTKLSSNNLNVNTVKRNMEKTIENTMTKSLRTRGWKFDLHTDDAEMFLNQYPTDVVGYNWLNETAVDITFTRDDDKQPDMNEVAALCRTFSTRCAQNETGKWQLSKVDGEEYTPPDGNEGMPTSKDFIEYAPVTLPEHKDWETAFEHLYGLDPHIGRVRSSFELAVMSGWDKREHVALVGPPGCGKSDIAHSFKSLIGDEAVLEFDATNMTQAGVVKELSEREILPRVIVIEEIEKADINALRFLLALLDTRGEIRKITARATIQRDTKCLCVATVNNVEMFNSIMSGALASRMGIPVTFRRPNRTTLKRILEREITKLGGDLSWADPALDFCEKIGEYDPRKVISVCLCGREMLLDGTYQDMMLATMPEPPIRFEDEGE